MPFLRAARVDPNVKAEAENISQEAFQRKLEEAAREMNHMNSLLSSIQLLLSGM